MKILFVNKFLYPNGGSETYIFKLGEELVRQGHEIQYFGMEHEGRIVGNHAEQYTDSMDFHTGKLKKLLYPMKIIYSGEAARKISIVLDDFKPDVVHLNNFNFQLTPSVIYSIRKWEKRNGKKIKIIYTAHDYQWVCPNHMMMIPSTGEVCFRCKGGRYTNCIRNRCIHGSLVKSILGAMEGRIYRRKKTYGLVDKVICPSRFLADKFDTMDVLRDKLIVMHNFIEPSTVIEHRTRDYVLYFGRYTKEKGVETLLEVCRDLKNIPFRFAGVGELQPEIAKLDNAEELGFLKGDNLKNCIANAAFVVYPSEWYENCPLSIMEALSMGVPVIASDLGGIPELVRDHMNGVLFRAGDVVELKEKIQELWKDHERLDRYADEAYRTDFTSLEEYVQKLVKCMYE